MTDGIAVFHDVLAPGDVAQGEFMAAGNVLAKRHDKAVDIDRLAFRKVRKRHGDVVRSIDFQESFHRFRLSNS